MKKILIGIAIVIPIVILSSGAYLNYALPNVGDAPDLKIDITPDRVARGKYLAYHVAVCMDCHSTRDWNLYSGPMIAGTDGKGGEYFGNEAGFPGKFYSKNITPSHLGHWSDGEIFRAITTGVSKNGSALFPVMPYAYYGKMDPEDIYDIIAFIRTLRPIENTTPEHSVSFPVNFLINTMPRKASPQKLPSKQDTVAYGSYLTNAAGCMECHSPVKNGQVIDGKEFVGGRDFKMQGMTVYSANLTPDTETGIGGMDAAEFVKRFKAFEPGNGTPAVTKNGAQTIMPWSMYAGMDSADLIAIHRYLKTLKPVTNRVTHFVAD